MCGHLLQGNFDPNFTQTVCNPLREQAPFRKNTALALGRSWSFGH